MSQGIPWKSEADRPFSWRCPYCHDITTIDPQTNVDISTHFYNSPSKDDHVALLTRIIVCPECKEYTIEAILYPAYQVNGDDCCGTECGPIMSWTLKPQSTAIPLPDYIPKEIAEDYYEACAIFNLSQKASATFSRRCLQRMICDFWEIKIGSLCDVIAELMKKRDEFLTNGQSILRRSLNAIDSTLKSGSISTHMMGRDANDVNLITDVDEDEARFLIKLLERLFRDWYISHHEGENKDE